jgi:hypothetical protein
MLINRPQQGFGEWDRGKPWWAELVDQDFLLAQRDEYHLIAETCLQPVSYGFGPGSQSVKFQAQAFDFRFVESNHWEALARLQTIARRLRGYVTFVSALPVPIRFAFAGDRVFIPSTYNSGPFPTTRIPGIKSNLWTVEGAKQLAKTMLPRLRKTDDLMDSCEPGSPLDRAMVHAGEALWAPDDLDVIFHCWRSLEAVAQQDVNESGRRNLKKIPGLSRTALRITWSVDKRIGIDLSKEVKELEGCRNAVAHGRVREQDVRTASFSATRQLGIAYAVVGSAAREFQPEATSLLETPVVEDIPPRTAIEEDPDFDERIRRILREQWEERRFQMKSG